MISLGVDPGSRVMGLAVTQKTQNKIHILACEAISLVKEGDHPERLRKIYSEIELWIRKYHPDTLIVETPVYGMDPMAMLKLGRAQAAVILSGLNNGVSVQEIFPKAVKKGITGNGNASKKQVAFMLQKLLPGQEIPASPDASDALAISVSALLKGAAGASNNPSFSSRKTDKKGSNSWLSFINQHPDRVKPT